MQHKGILERIFALALIVIFTSALSSCDKESKSIEVKDSIAVTIAAKIEPQFKYARKFTDNLAAVCVGNDDCKWGFINKDGKFSINPKFTAIGNFENGYAYVEFKKEGVLTQAILNKKNELALINSNSSFDIRLYEDGFTDYDISFGLVPFARLIDGKKQMGFADTKGAVKIEPIYTEVARFSEGMAAVKIGGEKGKWGFIDTSGKMVIEPQFQFANIFSDGMAHIRIGNYKEGVNGFINTKGQVVVTPKFKNVKDFYDGLAAVEITKDGTRKWGFINKSGELVIDAVFDFDIENFSYYFSNAMVFSDGLAAVQISGKQENRWGYIDKSGRMIIEAQFAEAKGFSDGLAGVRIGNAEEGKWGFIDKQGKFVVNPIYDDVQPFKEGMAAVQSGKGKESVWGFLEKK